MGWGGVCVSVCLCVCVCVCVWRPAALAAPSFSDGLRPGRASPWAPASETAGTVDIAIIIPMTVGIATMIVIRPGGGVLDGPPTRAAPAAGSANIEIATIEAGGRAPVGFDAHRCTDAALDKAGSRILDPWPLPPPAEAPSPQSRRRRRPLSRSAGRPSRAPPRGARAVPAFAPPYMGAVIVGQTRARARSRTYMHTHANTWPTWVRMRASKAGSHISCPRPGGNGESSVIPLEVLEDLSQGADSGRECACCGLCEDLAELEDVRRCRRQPRLDPAPVSSSSLSL